MANEQNLLKGKDTQFQSGEEAAINGAKGGKRSGESKREKKQLREMLEILLDKEYTDKKGNKVTGVEMIATSLIKEAIQGNKSGSVARAFETIRSTLGQDPVQKVMLAEVEQSVIDEVERAVLDE